MKRRFLRCSLVLLGCPGLAVSAPGFAQDTDAETVEFCLAGEADLGLRLQGMRPSGGEFSEGRWCVTSEDRSNRVHFHISGQSNPDLSDAFSVSYFPPDLIRIVNRDSPPDIEFPGADIAFEAARHRRIDPVRLVEEIEANPDWVVPRSEDGWVEVRYPRSAATVRLWIDGGKVHTLSTSADMPLRGRVPVRWEWSWVPSRGPSLELYVDGEILFRASGAWRTLSGDEASALWALSGGVDARELGAEHWPARVNMQLDTLAEGVYFVRGVRTGFQHLVVDTAEGLVVADAPAGWVELPQIPPVDLVPGLGISGLSERLIDYLVKELPGRPIRAVAVTHAHDDHAGGARAFAAAGADVYAPATISDWLASALNRPEMPADRLSGGGGKVEVLPVADRVRLSDEGNAVELLDIGPGPHVSASLGVLAADAGIFFVSDLHVPNSEAEAPRARRAVTECWFAKWAVANLEPEVIVVNSHTPQVSPVSRLARYLESEPCR